MIRRFYRDLPHGQIHGRIARTDGAPWLLLLHQSPSSSVMYELLMEALAGRFSLLAPDTPGFGQSDPLPGADIPAFAACMKRLLDSFEIERAFVFGHHTGASIAGEFAAVFGERCAALALCGPPVLSEERRRTLPAAAPVEALQEDGAHLMRLWKRLRDKEAGTPLALTQRELCLAFSAPEATAAAYSAVAAHDLGARLGEVACPVLVFAGLRDSLIDCVEPAAKAARARRVVVLPDAGTYVCERAPQQVADLLVDFFLESSHGS